jgi:hypothetical protein
LCCVSGSCTGWYARDEFVYWGFSAEGLRRLGRIVGFDEVEVVDRLEIDAHPRILALLRAASCPRVHVSRSRSMLPRRARPVGGGPGGWRRISRCPPPQTTPGQTFSGSGQVTARDRSTVERELALRPGFSARARMPPTARSAPRGERRGLLVLTAGPVPYFYGRYPTGQVDASQSD